MPLQEVSVERLFSYQITRAYPIRGGGWGWLQDKMSKEVSIVALTIYEVWRCVSSQEGRAKECEPYTCK
jgi:hypothetical protein